MTWPQVRVLGMAFGLVVGSAGKALAQTDVPPVNDQPVYDCGTLSLYHLLRLEGRSITLSAIESHLTPPEPRGYSLQELRGAARRLGVSLRGIHLHERARAPDRSLLVFVNRSEHGHFLVVRPVGHTGNLLQVLDGVREPSVVDAVALYTAPGWTGFALLPARPNWPLRIGAGAVLASGLALFVAQRLRRRGRPRSRTRGLERAILEVEEKPAS